MNKIPNRQAICEVLMDKAKEDKDIMVLCSDSRGSASMTPFADNFPDQFIETGNLYFCSSLFLLKLAGGYI